MATPTENQWKVLKAVKLLEEGKSAVVNSGTAEECEDLGWLDVGKGSYTLTAAGRALLAGK